MEKDKTSRLQAYCSCWMPTRTWKTEEIRYEKRQAGLIIYLPRCHELTYFPFNNCFIFLFQCVHSVFKDSQRAGCSWSPPIPRDVTTKPQWFLHTRLNGEIKDPFYRWQVKCHSYRVGQEFHLPFTKAKWESFLKLVFVLEGRGR